MAVSCTDCWVFFKYVREQVQNRETHREPNKDEAVHFSGCKSVFRPRLERYYKDLLIRSATDRAKIQHLLELIDEEEKTGSPDKVLDALENIDMARMLNTRAWMKFINPCLKSCGRRLWKPPHFPEDDECEVGCHGGLFSADDDDW